MRNLYIVAALTFALSACGGGSGNTPPSQVPVGVVSGKTFDGLIIGGTVTVYDFSTGSKGPQLAQTQSDSNGLYNFSLQVESRPILIEITGGYYSEEASNLPVALKSSDKLTALTNYTTGTPLQVAVTTYTHLAAGLAAYKIQHGSAVPAAINDANQHVSGLAGINIVTTTPLEITDPNNLGVALTPELKYGFLAGAISLWTYNNPLASTLPHATNYASIDFAQLLYKDIAADGLLDGMGLDSAGNPVQLSFGTTPLGADVYRLGIGVGLIQMAQHRNNKTGLGPSQVLPFAQAYAANTDAMFNNIVPIPIALPVVTITSHAPNAWMNNTANVVASIQDTIGIVSTEFLVDNVSVATSTSNNTTQAFQLDTTKYSDGLHTLSIRTIDLVGFPANTTISIGVDNTAPTSTGILPTILANGAFVTFSAQGCASDAGSGIQSVTNLQTGSVVTPASSGCWVVSDLTYPSSTNNFQLLIKDKANNCSIYNAQPALVCRGCFNDSRFSWALASSGACH